MKFIHIADLHLDTPLVSLRNNRDLIKKRRTEQRQVFSDVINKIKAENIEYLFISGDLFEQKFVEKICDLLKDAGSLQINGGVIVRVRRGVLDFPQEEANPEPVKIENGRAAFAGASIETQIININEINNLQNILKQGLEYFLDCDKILGDVTVRSRAAGDKITLKSRGVTKSLKKLFNELAVPPEKRNGIAVFADDGGVILVEGVGCDARAAVTKATEKVMIVKIKR